MNEGTSDRFVVVGCGTVVPEPGTGCSCYYLEMGGARLLLDCGSGSVQGLARLGLPWQELTHVVLTHFHVDHVGDLPGLFFSLRHGLESERRDRLEVWGPPGTRDLFRALGAAFGDFLLDPGFPLTIGEIAPGEDVRLGSVGLRVHKTPHTTESQAVRLESGSAAVVYTGDSGPEEGLGEFASRSRLFVCECSLLDEEVGDNHLSPARVARLAEMARPDVLLLTHLYPHLRGSGDAARLVAEAGYGGTVSVAHQGWSIEL